MSPNTTISVTIIDYNSKNVELEVVYHVITSHIILYGWYILTLIILLMCINKHLNELNHRGHYVIT